MRPGFIKQASQLIPDLGSRGVTHQHPVLDKPRSLATPERPDGDLDAIFLHVAAPRQEQSTFLNGTHPVVFAAFQQALPVGCFAFLDPRFTEFSVLEGLDGGGRSGFLADGTLPCGGDFPPVTPTNRAVQARQMETGGLARYVSHCSPFAVFQHPRLVMLRNRYLAGLADVGGRVGPITVFVTLPS